MIWYNFWFIWFINWVERVKRCVNNLFAIVGGVIALIIIMEPLCIWCVLDVGFANLIKCKYCIRIHVCLDNMLDAVVMSFFVEQCCVFQVGFKNGKGNTNKNKFIKKIHFLKKIESINLKKLNYNTDSFKSSHFLFLIKIKNYLPSILNEYHLKNF